MNDYRMKRISLVRSAGISMPYHRFSKHGDNLRFGRLFRETWPQLPLFERRRLVRFWRSRLDARGIPEPYPFPGGKHSPLRVEILQFMPDWAGDSAVGCCHEEGNLLGFLAPAVDALPDEAVRTLIAHELAHACLRAEGVPLIPADPSALYDWEESTVREMTDEWGFDEEGLDSALQETVLHSFGSDNEPPG